MPIHDWSLVHPGTFHDFHMSWVAQLSATLNTSALPPGYYSLVEQHGHLAEFNRIIKATPAPPLKESIAPDDETFYRLARRTVAIRQEQTDRLAAMIEILSPGDKDGEQHLRQFVVKAVAAIQHEIHLLVIDLFAPGRFDPEGIHEAIWSIVGGRGFRLPDGKPLTLVSYLAKELPEAYVEPIAVGDALPNMPLFLEIGRYIPAPLEATYTRAYNGVPAFVKEIVEGRAPPEQ